MPCCWPKPRSHSASQVAAGAYPDGVAHDHNHERGPGAAEPRKCTAVHVRGRSPVTLKVGTSKFTRHSCSPSRSVRCIWCSNDRKAASSRRPAKLMGPVISWSPRVETNRRRAASTLPQSLEGRRPVLASLIVTNFCRGMCQCHEMKGQKCPLRSSKYIYRTEKRGPAWTLAGSDVQSSRANACSA